MDFSINCVRLSVDELISTSPAAVCDLCLKSFKSSSALRLHRVKVHKIIETLTDESIFRKKSSKVVENRYFCPISGCKYEFKEKNVNYFHDRRSLKQHFDKVHSEKRFVCSICRLCKFSLERDKRYHEKKCGQKSTKNVGKTIGVVAPVVINQPIFIISRLSTAPVVRPAQNSTRELLPKPNSSWRCFVDKVDAAVQTDVGTKSAVKLSPKASVSKHISTQYEIDESSAEFFDQPRPSSSCSLHLYDETACQTSSVQTFVAAVQSVVAQTDIFCQTNVPSMTDASVSADINVVSLQQQREESRLNTPPFVDGFDDNSAWSNIETQTDVSTWAGVDFDDIWRHMQTQTTDDDALLSTLQQNIQTQTSFLDFLDPALFHSAGTQT